MIRKNRIKTMVLFLCVCGLAAALKMAAHSAEVEITGSVKNTSRSSVVDISLEKYFLVENQLQREPMKETVLPGELYSFVPLIRNEGSDCYIRIKLGFQSVLDEQGLSDALLSTEHLIGLSHKWIVRNDYLYYTDVLPHGESIQVFEGIQLPNLWGKEYAGLEVAVNLFAEAVQSSEFDPDFQAQSPWGDFQSERSKEIDYDYEGLSTTSKKWIAVAYEEEAGKIMITPDDFFSGFEAMLPGQIYTDEVEVSNDSGRKISLFLKIEAETMGKKSENIEELLSQQYPLLSQMYIRIERTDSFGNRSLLYEGKYLDKQLWESIPIGSYEKGEKASLIFSLYLPSELTNVYALLNENSLWTFMAKSVEVQKETEKELNQKQQTIIEKIVQTAAKTGDYAPVLLLLFLVIVSFFVLSFVVGRSVKRGKKGNNKR